ncbi:MAG: hypothetical protein M0023_09985 [Desulfobacteraceae bacterium]|nr:hypothetical protein [Desulfobacteraceae bacterium]
MRRLIASTFVSLDGIMQAPGGPEEDPTGGDIRPGSFASVEPSEKELARRTKMANGMW